MSIEIVITDEISGVKPKNFLKKKLDVPYTKIIKLIRNKMVTLNNKKIRQDDVLKTGDIIKVWSESITLREAPKKSSRALNLNMSTFFENEDFLVLNKESGVVVQGAQDSNESLSLHLEYLKRLAKVEDTWMHVHRIDKDTSGGIIIGKNPVTIRKFNKLFHDKKVVKIYHAICVGLLEKKEGEINLNLVRNPDGSKQKVSVGKDGKETLSRYKVLEDFEYDDEDFSLVEIEIVTGFMHQIRVHMAHLKNPLLGDYMYGIRIVNDEFKEVISRHALHAKYLGFELKGENYKLDIPYTKDFDLAIKKLRN